MYRKTKLNISSLPFDYSIDTEGVVINESFNKPMRGTSITANNRYVKIHLDKFYALHRLVAEHFVPNLSNLPQVNHINGNRYDNRACNLEWCTARHNVLHAYSTGLKTNRGEINPVAQLTEDNVRQVWALRNSGLSHQQIVDRLRLPVTASTVKAIRLGKNWSWLTDMLS